MKRVVSDIAVLVYGRVFDAMVRMNQSRDLARFSALVQTALLGTLNLLAFVFLVAALLKPANGEIGPHFWLTLKVVVPLTAIVVFAILLKITNRSKDDYRRVGDLDSGSARLIFAALYPYLVFGLFATSIAALMIC